MNSNKEELLNTLSALIDKYPDMRIGQLVTNVSYWALGPKKESAWEVTNEQWLTAARDNLQSNSAP
ncbi:MAG: hypothetical protein MJK04_15060 [Psychrosphaera sp.]|nr:hypothetical protein [Psychrosphaera sp.]